MEFITQRGISMSVARRRTNRRHIAHAALLASASVMSLGFASEAQAQCVTNNGQPLNPVAADLTIVTCTGAITSQTVTVTANQTEVNVTGNGTVMDGGSNIFSIGNENIVFIDAGAEFNASTVYLQGQSGILGINGSSTGSGFTVDGDGSHFAIDILGSVTLAPGNLRVFASPTGTNNIILAGTLTGSASTGSYLIEGGDGQQRVFVRNIVTVQSDGLALNTRDGDDEIYIQTNGSFVGGAGNNILLEGGNGNDLLGIRTNGTFAFNTSGIETISIDPGSAGSVTLSGDNVDATQFNLDNGTVNIANLAALGLTNSNVFLSAGSQMNLVQAAAGTFNHTLSGSGTLALTSGAGVTTFGGTSNGFNGTFLIGTGGTAILLNEDAFGTANFINGGTVQFGGGITLDNDIAGIGNVIKTGVGQSTLSGNNSYSGGTIVQGGQLNVANGSALGTGGVAINSGAILNLDFAADGVFSNDVSGAGVLSKSGNATVTLTGTNSYTGGTNLNAGGLRVDSFARLGTGPVTSNGGSSLILNYNGAGQLLQTTPFLTGGGTFIKEGSGNVVIDVANTYAGGTIIRAGTLGLNDGLGLGTGAIQVDAGASLGIGGVNLSNDVTGSGNIVKTAGNQASLLGDNSGFTGLIDIQGGVIGVEDGRSAGSGSVNIGAGTALQINSTVGDTTIAANLGGAGNFDKLDASRVTLTGTNLLTGNVFVDNGTLQVEGSQNIGTATINLAGAGATLDLSTAGSTTLSNNVTGSGRLVKTGSGTVFLTGANTYAGGTDIQQGAIRVTDTSFLGTGAINVQAGAALDLSIAGAQTLGQSVTGAGILRKSNTGDLTLLSNGLTGGVDIVGGRVIVSTAGALGGGGVSTAADTQLVFDTATTETISNTISGAGALTKDGTGVLVIQNANSYTGGTIINAGRLGLNHGQGLGSGDILILQGGQLSLGGITLANNISGAGQVVKTANNDGVLTGTNTHTGGTDIQGGTLTVLNPAALGTGGVTIASGTALAVDYSGSTNVALANALSGAGALVKNGSGTVVVNNSNSFSGGTSINAGRLGLNFGDGLGTGPVSIASGASLALGDLIYANATSGAGQIVKTSAGVTVLTGTNTHTGGTDLQGGTLTVLNPDALGTGGVTMASGTALAVDYSGSTSVSLANALTGAGALVKNGSGTVVVNNSNSYTGGTSINAGRVELNLGNGLGAGAVSIASGASLALGDLTYANATSGAGQIVKTSAGQTLLTGTNSHSGGIVIQAGTLGVTSNAALGTGPISVSSGAAFEYANASAATFGNVLSGAGTFRKLGAGLLSFGGNFSIGTLDLLAGRTRINTIGTTNVTVGSGATLDGTGRIIGNLTNNGIVAPGNSIGTLTVQGNYTHNASSVLEIEFDGAGNMDLLDVTGNAMINGGTLRFVSIGGAEGQGGTFLRTGGTLTGTFANVETAGALLPLAVLYQPNAALMAPSVLTARPSTFNAQSLAAADTALGFIDSLSAGEAHVGAGNRIWMNGFGAWSKRSAFGSTLAYDHDMRGLSGGINLKASDALTIGAAIGWAQGDITLGQNGGGGEQSSVLGSVTVRYLGDGFTAGAGLVYGQVDQETLRNVSFNGFAGSVDGETDSNIFGGFAELGVELGSTGGWDFRAKARGSYVRQKQDGYTESGTSPLRLSLGDLNTETLEGQARLSARKKLWSAETMAEDVDAGLALRFDLGARYLGALGDREIPVTFAVSNAGIVLQGDTRNTLQGMFGAVLDYTTRSGAIFSIGYNGEIGKTDRHAVQVGASFAF